MKHVIQIKVYRSDEQYIAEGVDIAIATFAKTLDGLVKNIQEAVELYLEDEDPKKNGYHLQSFYFGKFRTTCSSSCPSLGYYRARM